MAGVTLLVLPLPNESRIDQVIQFALAAAAREDDPRQRKLGPIHLVKYTYLGDLAYAKAHSGETFTGAPWRFHHYGPWAAEVFQRIEPAASAVGATRETFRSPKYDSDVVRYLLEDDALFEGLERLLPWEVVSSVRRSVHEHGADTESLLHHVYTTSPMLQAAPGQTLDFSSAERERKIVFDSEARPAQQFERAALALKDFVAEPIVWSQRRVDRERRRALRELRERVQARLADRLARHRRPPSPPPRYDEVFLQGTQWLDQLAGPRPAEGEAEAVFSDDVWKAPTRGGRDLP
jgi:hypothetical protein